MLRNNTAVIGLAMLGLGIGIGWLAKPAADPAKPKAVNPAKAVEVVAKPSSPAPPAESPAPVPPGKRALREPTVKKPAGMPGEEMMENAKKMQAEMTKAMLGRQRAKTEQYLKRLEDSLGLTADQKNRMDAWLDERMKKLENVDFSDPESMKGLSDVLGGINTKDIDNELAKILSAEQQTALGEFREKEHRTKVDSAALKSLSKLQKVIEFEEGQRDEVFKMLTAEAEENVRKAEENPDPAEAITEGMGIEMDPYDLGIQQAMADAIAEMGGERMPTDQKQIAKIMREVIDRRIDAKIEKLRPVLNARQLEQYSAELKTKGAGIYGTALMGMEGAASHDNMFAVPTK